MSIFEPIITRSQITEATREVLEAWMPAYVAEIERQNGLAPEDLEVPGNVTIRTSFAQWDTEAATPAILIVSQGLVSPAILDPGIYGEPTSDGEGRWQALWGLTVGAIVSGEDPDAIQEKADLYAAAIRGCLLQRQPLPGIGASLRWTGETYVGIPEEESLGIASARVGFECRVPLAVEAHAGPAPGTEPPANPYEPPEDWPTVETTHLSVDPLEET